MDDTYKYNSVDVAKYIIAQCNKAHFGINMTKMQKLLYIVYGVYLAIYNQRLTNEHPQAWPFGPVFPTTRNKLLHKDFFEISMKDIKEESFKELSHDNNLNQVVDLVLQEFGKWNATQLTKWSHKKGTPWDLTSKQFNFRWGDEIPDIYIQEYFNHIIVRD